MKKELIIFTVILLILSVGMHLKEWMDHPLTHLTALPSSGAYGIGAAHPVVFTLIIYLIFIALRGVVRIFKR
jgi:hypothetical protein